MQATMQRFVLSPTGIGIFAISIVLNFVLVVVALNQSGALPSIGDDTANVKRPAVAHSSPDMGEGRLGGIVPLAAPAPITYDTSGLGEGRLSTAGATRSASVARDTTWLGEGRLNAAGATQSAFVAHAAVGQGEGWLANGRPADD